MTKRTRRRGLLAAITGTRFSRRITEHVAEDPSRVATGGPYPRFASFEGDILIIGWGAIAQGLIALLLRHLTIDRSQIIILNADEDGRTLAKDLGLRFVLDRLTSGNIAEVFQRHARSGTLVISLAVDVSSVELIRLCQQHGCLYVDTSVEPWARGYNANNAEHRTTYYFRQNLLDIRPMAPPGALTAVAGHGANPGLVSHFAKQAVWTASGGDGDAQNLSRGDWIALARDAGIEMLQLSERDSQDGPLPNDQDLFNTWSIDAYIGEALQQAEISVGLHEAELPEGARSFTFGQGGAVYLPKPGAWTPSRGWEPHGGPFTGMVFTHYEVLSIADYFTGYGTDGSVAYRPGVFYTYRPCDHALRSLDRYCRADKAIWSRNRWTLMTELTHGSDNLGAIAYRADGQAVWYGSCLKIDDARRLAPFNNATSLQVCAGALAAVVYAIRNPRAGLVEAEALDSASCMEIASRYLGDIAVHRFDWRPLLPNLRFSSFLSDDPVIDTPLPPFPQAKA